MENKIKISEIRAAARDGKIEQDIPATFFLVSAGDDDGGSLLGCSSIDPKNDGDLAKRWIVLASIGILKGCLEGDPKAWEVLAYWKALKYKQEEQEAKKKECDLLLDAILNRENAPKEEGEQEQ